MLMLEKAVAGVLEKWVIAAKGSLGGASLLEMQYTACGTAFFFLNVGMTRFGFFAGKHFADFRATDGEQQR